MALKNLINRLDCTKADKECLYSVDKKCCYAPIYYGECYLEKMYLLPQTNQQNKTIYSYCVK